MILNSLRDKSIVGSPVLHLCSLMILLFAFWLLVSGSLQAKFISFGILASVSTALLTYPLLLIPNTEQTQKYFLLGLNPFRLFVYIAWLTWQLIIANFDVLRATVRTELRINPRVVKFRYQAEHPIAKVWLANSITLTPGTVTLTLSEDGLFEVHALTDSAAEGLKAGDMQKKVSWLLGTSHKFEILGESF